MVNKLSPLLSLILVINSAWAGNDATYLVQSSSVSNIQYEAFLKTNSQYKPISDKWFEQRIYDVSPTKLRTLFDEAEKSFLSEPVEVAHDKYKQVLALAFKADWSDSERKLIFHAFIRTAQTAVSDKKRTEYLVRSKEFDSKLSPDDNLFPPPLVKEWAALQAKDIFKIVQLGKSFATYNTAFINGRRIDFKRFTVLVPKGEFRLTLISNSRLPYTKILNSERIEKLSPSSALLVEGSCDRPIFSKDIKAVALFAGDCVTAQTKTDSLARNYLDTFNEKSELENRISARADLEERPFYKSGVFWAAAGAVAAFIIYKQQEKEREDSPTTHKTGF